MDKSVDEDLSQDVGPAVKEDPDVVVSIERREECAHVRRKNSEQRHTPQNIDKNDALGKADRAHMLGFLLHAPNPQTQ